MNPHGRMIRAPVKGARAYVCLQPANLRGLGGAESGIQCLANGRRVRGVGRVWYNQESVVGKGGNRWLELLSLGGFYVVAAGSRNPPVGAE